MTYKEALEKIATVNAMDYEYQAWAREALAKQEQGEPWGACVFGRVFVGALPEHVRKLSEDEGLPIQWLYTTPQQRKPLTDEQIDKAAMKLAECMDYPWAHMPEEGKRNMRKHAKAIIEAAHGIKE